MAKHFREPQTSNERRAVEACDIGIRAKRNTSNLVNAWDDIPNARQPRSDRYKNKRR